MALGPAIAGQRPAIGGHLGLGSVPGLGTEGETEDRAETGLGARAGSPGARESRRGWGGKGRAWRDVFRARTKDQNLPSADEHRSGPATLYAGGPALEATGHGVRAKCSKSSAVSFDLLDQRNSRAVV